MGVRLAANDAPGKKARAAGCGGMGDLPKRAILIVNIVCPVLIGLLVVSA